jgi:hypothetical protein
MEPQSEFKQIISQYEKLLVALAADGIDFAVVGGLAVTCGKSSPGKAGEAPGSPLIWRRRGLSIRVP